jgi:hypothetical protein
LLKEEDPAVVISVAVMGLKVGSHEEFPGIIRALFRVAPRLNWFQEDEVIRLLDEHKALAHSEAKQTLAHLLAHGQRENWLSPTWRILGHLDGWEIKNVCQ